MLETDHDDIVERIMRAHAPRHSPHLKVSHSTRKTMEMDQFEKNRFFLNRRPPPTCRVTFILISVFPCL